MLSIPSSPASTNSTQSVCIPPPFTPNQYKSLALVRKYTSTTKPLPNENVRADSIEVSLLDQRFLLLLLFPSKLLTFRKKQM